MRPAQRTAATVLEWLGDGRRVAAGLSVGIDGSAPHQAGAMHGDVTYIRRDRGSSDVLQSPER